MASKKQATQCNPNFYIVASVVVLLVIIALSSLTHTSLALKENSQGKSGIIRQNCINGLQQAAINSGVCSLDDLQQIGGIINIREVQGVKAAKDACFSRMTNPGCKGLCTALINCFDLQ